MQRQIIIGKLETVIPCGSHNHLKDPDEGAATRSLVPVNLPAGDEHTARPKPIIAVGIANLTLQPMLSCTQTIKMAENSEPMLIEK
jgi:hypothetical protein